MAPERAGTVVVVGSGPCAAVAARELVATGLDVLMLDAGRGSPRGLTVHVAGRTLLRLTQPGFLHHNRQRAASDPRITWTSSLSRGGLTNFWTGAVPRFAPADFTEGAAIDERYVWPIGYADLEPFYDLVEDDLCVTRGDDIPGIPSGRAAYQANPAADWVDFAARARKLEHPMGPIPIANGAPWMAVLRPREFTSYHGVVRHFADAPNFRLQQNARVVRVGYDPARGLADSITYVDLAEHRTHTIPARAVLIAAGALDSTEILLRSQSSEFPAGLGNVHAVLGRYFHDHPRVWWQVRLATRMTAPAHPMYIARDTSHEADPLLASSMTIGVGAHAARIAALVNAKVRKLGVQVLGTMVPEDRPGLTLVDDIDAGDPRSALRIDVRFAEPARRNMRAARERLAQIFGDCGNPVELGADHEPTPGESVHYGGTVRMHDRPEFGMLDRDNRVHGVPNVVVCDASCFTTGPEKNPTLTAMAIAARAGRSLAAALT